MTTNVLTVGDTDEFRAGRDVTDRPAIRLIVGSHFELHGYDYDADGTDMKTASLGLLEVLVVRVNAGGSGNTFRPKELFPDTSFFLTVCYCCLRASPNLSVVIGHHHAGLYALSTSTLLLLLLRGNAVEEGYSIAEKEIGSSAG